MPRSRATWRIGRPDSNASRTARSRDSNGYFLGAPSPEHLLPQDGGCLGASEKLRVLHAAGAALELTPPRRCNRCLAKPDASHFRLVANALAEGDVVAFLGAGITWCDRPAGSAFEVGTYLPDGKELSRDLVKRFGYPGDTQGDDEQRDPAKKKDRELSRVAQYVDLMAGRRT